MTTRRLRVLYLHPALGIGGAEELRLLTMKHLDRTRYDARVCCLGERGRIASEIEALGVPVDALGCSDRSFDVRTTWAVYRYLCAHRPDVLQTSLFRTNWHGRLAGVMARVPVLIAEEHSLHDPSVGFYRYSPRAAGLFRRVDRWLAMRSERVLACSRAVAESIAADERIPMDRFVVAHNAVDEDKLQPVEGREAARARLGYAAGDVVVGAVSSLTPVKGYPLLLDAFAEARRMMPSLRLLIVGDGPARTDIERRVAGAGLSDVVRLVGAQRALGDYLAAMDVFASAAVSEGFGINFVEAMGSGRPCVAFRLGGIPEVVVDGETGLLVTPGDIGAMASALVTLAGDPGRRVRMGDAGRARVERLFTASHYVDRLQRLYDDIGARFGLGVSRDVAARVPGAMLPQ
jgi:glycosyltransferase involved in cell wall biosynthesis